MKVGIPAEVKSDEYRVAMMPVGVERLAAAGHEVFVQSGAGLGSGFPDEAYRAAGAKMVVDGPAVFQSAEMIVKVKEPQPSEFPLIKSHHTLFTYFHFASSRELTVAMMDSGATCVAYETLRDARGTLPLLTPMSEVAGRMSIQEGAKYLEKPQMGRGILLGGVPGVPPAHITILGGGIVGTNAARIASGFRADVTILDINLDRLRHLDEVMPANVNAVFSDRHNIIEQLRMADLVIGAVLIPGAKAPRLVTREDLKQMKPGAVIVDVAVDQGGCIETTRPTTHADPTFVIDDVVHYCVANMPGAVGRTSTQALCNATTAPIVQLADAGGEAANHDPVLSTAVNIHAGQITHPAVASAFPDLSATAANESSITR